jgi:hypothetical protein
MNVVKMEVLNYQKVYENLLSRNAHSKDRDMTRVVSRRPVTADVNPYGIYGGHTATAAGFTRVLQFSPIGIIL